MRKIIILTICVFVCGVVYCEGYATMDGVMGYYDSNGEPVVIDMLMMSFLTDAREYRSEIKERYIDMSSDEEMLKGLISYHVDMYPASSFMKSYMMMKIMNAFPNIGRNEFMNSDAFKASFNSVLNEYLEAYEKGSLDEILEKYGLECTNALGPEYGGIVIVRE